VEVGQDTFGFLSPYFMVAATIIQDIRNPVGNTREPSSDLPQIGRISDSGSAMNKLYAICR